MPTPTDPSMETTMTDLVTLNFATPARIDRVATLASRYRCHVYGSACIAWTDMVECRGIRLADVVAAPNVSAHLTVDAHRAALNIAVRKASQRVDLAQTVAARLAGSEATADGWRVRWWMLDLATAAESLKRGHRDLREVQAGGQQAATAATGGSPAVAATVNALRDAFNALRPFAARGHRRELLATVPRRQTAPQGAAGSSGRGVLRDDPHPAVFGDATARWRVEYWTGVGEDRETQGDFTFLCDEHGWSEARWWFGPDALLVERYETEAREDGTTLFYDFERDSEANGDPEPCQKCPEDYLDRGRGGELALLL